MSSFKYITTAGVFDAEAHGISIITRDIPLLPTKRKVSEKVIGRNGNIVFEDAYDNKIISLECTFIDGVPLQVRRQTIREVSIALSKPGELILNYEPDKKYIASISNTISVKINPSYDTFSLTIEVEPLAVSAYDLENLTWNQASMSWYAASFPWIGYKSTFDIVVASQSINVINLGNFESAPIIALTGVTATTKLALGAEDFTITGLNGTIYVDIKNLIVYSGSGPLVNELAKFSGDFFTLQPGDNNIIVTSTGLTSLAIGFENQDTWI